MAGGNPDSINEGMDLPICLSARRTFQYLKIYFDPEIENLSELDYSHGCI